MRGYCRVLDRLRTNQHLNGGPGPPSRVITYNIIFSELTNLTFPQVNEIVFLCQFSEASLIAFSSVLMIQFYVTAAAAAWKEISTLITSIYFLFSPSIIIHYRNKIISDEVRKA